MQSVWEVIQTIFGGSISADKVISIVVSIYAVIKSITEFIAKRKLIKAELEETALLKELKLAREENKVLKSCMSKVSDIVLTCYLSSNTIPVETKMKVAKYGEELNKIAEIPLAETTSTLINAVTQIIPQNTLNEHKEEIEEAAKLSEELIDTANEVMQDAIDKIKV